MFLGIDQVKHRLSMICSTTTYLKKHNKIFILRIQLKPFYKHSIVSYSMNSLLETLFLFLAFVLQHKFISTIINETLEIRLCLRDANLPLFLTSYRRSNCTSIQVATTNTTSSVAVFLSFSCPFSEFSSVHFSIRWSVGFNLLE